jgi:sulfur carrier protein ThiS
MLSDLSPGDRLSLKGKLFDLQKKLSIIDLEHKLEEQYSYQPKIKTYDLPNRPRDFMENNVKAEIIRQVIILNNGIIVSKRFWQQKKKLLQDSLAQQTEEVCTFAPTLYTSADKFNIDNRPVGR